MTMRLLLATLVVLGVFGAVEASQLSTEVGAALRAQTTTQVQAKVEEEPSTFGPCKTCVFVVERIKKGTNMLLPAICSEIFTQFPSAYGTCHQVLNSLSLNGNNVRYWLFEGCYHYEIYNAKGWVKPCPSHVMNTPFCPPLPMEDPFAVA